MKMKKRWCKKIYVENARVMLGSFSGIPLIFLIDADENVIIATLLFVIPMIFSAFLLVLKYRPCGHCGITQGRSGFYFPFLIDKCYICGESYGSVVCCHTAR